MKFNLLISNLKKIVLSAMLLIAAVGLNAQSVYDVISGTGIHTSLTAAIDAAGLTDALSDTEATAEYTIFAPTDAAFEAALAELGVTLADLAADPAALSDILLYHVVDGTVLSSELESGVVPALNTANTIKVSVGDLGVFVNQAEVIDPDNSAENGVVHITNGVILATETVVDVALGTGVHGVLVDAVIAAELLPALTNPFATLTVFAPTDDAFVAALGELGLTAEELLASEGLADILTYHVLDSEVLSGALMNGMLAAPLNTANTIKVTVGDSGVFVNQAEVTGADNQTGNGVVHVTDGVILSNETVADTILGSADHTVLVLAVVEAELLPALTNPFTELTVFAPTDAAFTTALGELGISAADLLADATLGDILLYHVVAGTVLSTDLENGNVPTLSGEDVIVNIDMGAMINSATVSTPDLTSDNGAVHVIDAVLFSTYLSVEENKLDSFSMTVYPNPSSDFISVNTNGSQFNLITVMDYTGKIMIEEAFNSRTKTINVSGIATGQYLVTLSGNDNIVTKKLLIK